MPYPDFARPHETGPVQAQHLNGHTSYGGSAYDSGVGGTPAEVVMPVVPPGVEERCDTASANVQRMSAGVLVVVAPETAKTQIVKVVSATTRRGENVVNSKRVACIVHARATILAESLPSLLDTLTQPEREATHRRVFNASARRSIMSSPSCKRLFSSRRSALVRRRS